MFIEVTRSQAITAMQHGTTIFFGPAGHIDKACGYEMHPRKYISRRKAAKYPNGFRWLYPKGTKYSWWVNV